MKNIKKDLPGMSESAESAFGMWPKTMRGAN